MYENKEEALKELNKIIDNFGIGFNELKENYNNKTVNTKKKNKVRIRLLSENEAILKLIISYGNKANAYTWPTDYYINPGLSQSGNSYYLYSQNKYGIDCGQGCYFDNSAYSVLAPSQNKITILNNYYVYAAGSTNHCGFLSQNSSMSRFINFSGNGYGTLFQDNYEDKPELRCRVYFWSRGSGANASGTSRNGYVALQTYRLYSNYSNWKTINEPLVTTYKTSAANYQGMLPVFVV